MQNEKIYLERIKRFLESLKKEFHSTKIEIEAEYINHPQPIPYHRLELERWQKINVSQIWGRAWSSGWFKVKGIFPEQVRGKNVGLWFDCDGEACVFKEGTPWLGLTPKVDWYHNAAKYYVPLTVSAVPGESFEILIESAANDLFGSGKDEYTLRECSLICFDEELFQFSLDLEILFDLANSLSPGNVRRAKIVYGLNMVCNVYDGGLGLSHAKKIAASLMAKRAHESALSAFSVGHAHLDLAWLWPIRETKRKGGRSFANALRLIEQYPEYIFGASQAQLYQWMREEYPSLYEEVKAAYKRGSWEVQGASWVEFDTNLISGESIIRQFIYGKRFFQQEFGKNTDYLWLPDCFGFSANLPQFLKGCGVEFFMTQKLSWNESNVFPHHLFIWQGVDGSEVRAHQLPTNDYNFSNNPSAFVKADERFAQAELADGYLNLYGIGDGGGGPTRNHIEYGKRLRDLEGNPKFLFSKAEDFFAYYRSIPRDVLPTCYGELYLEFHRGTYTTQAKMKKFNVMSERLLYTAELLATLSLLFKHEDQCMYPQLLSRIWQDTLLMQFHDILPGSSIGQVYTEAYELCLKNHNQLRNFINEKLSGFVSQENDETSYLIFNPCSVDKMEWLQFPEHFLEWKPLLSNCEIIHSGFDNKEYRLLIKISAFSFATIRFEQTTTMQKRRVVEDELDNGSVIDNSVSFLLENEMLRVEVSKRGTLLSVVDKEWDRSFLEQESNLLQLWEDKPNNWGAWDINHFYRETKPQCVIKTELISLLQNDKGYSRIVQKLFLSNSTIWQTIELYPGSRVILISHEIDWQEHHKMLRVSFTQKIRAEHATCGVQLATVERSTVPHNQWEAARFEFPAQGFVDLSDTEYGCSLLCAEKFGFSIQENRIEMALLRSPADVDPQADIGMQSHKYAFYCHASSYQKSDVRGQVEALATNLIMVKGGPFYPMPEQSLFSLEKGLLLINTIKPSEDGRDVIVRLYEPLGRNVTDRLLSSFRFTKAWKCNLLEEPEQEVEMTAPISANRFEIITLRLEVDHDS